MKTLRRGLIVIGMMWMMISLAGCSMPKLVFNPEELYSLPELPAKYTELNNRINAVLSDGAEYAAPALGTNIQPVQLVDLNGDGREEAVAFFRKTTEEKPLKIHIFTAEEDAYRRTHLIEGTGLGFYSIAYEDLDQDGWVELIVGWKVAAEQQVLEVYKHKEHPESLIRTNYVKYVISDLNEDGKRELVVLRADEEGSSVADYYGWQEDGSIAAQAPARVSVTMAELSQQGRVTAGTLRSGRPALFVTGVNDDAIAITDVLVVRNGELSNIVLSEQTGVSGEIALFCGLYPADVNGDGVTDVPRPVVIGEQTSASQNVEWYDYGEDGAAASSGRTYHNTGDRWYFRIPEAWRGKIAAERIAATGQTAVTFSLQESGEAVLRITMYTGRDRELKAGQGEQFVLSRQAERVYTAELLPANNAWEQGLTADEVRAAFSMITVEWVSGDN